MAESTQVHDPARGVEEQVETREETIERVLEEDAEYRRERGVRESPELGGAGGDAPSADVSTRRGFNLALTSFLGIGAIVGAVLGALAGVGLEVFAGDNALKGTGQIAFVVSLALVGLIVGAIIAAYVQLGEEDGRVERAVEGDLDRDTDAVGKGPDPNDSPVPGEDRRPVTASDSES